MKLIEPSYYLSLREEINENLVIWNKNKFKPSREEFGEFVRFLLLLNSTGVGHMCESYANDEKFIDHLYETTEFNSEDQLNELEWTGGSLPKEYEPEKDFDSAVGSVKTAAMVLIGTAVAAGLYVAYLVRLRKLRKSLNDEWKAIQSRYDDYKKLNELKLKKWELEGKKGEIPQAVLPPVE